MTGEDPLPSPTLARRLSAWMIAAAVAYVVYGFRHTASGGRLWRLIASCWNPPG